MEELSKEELKQVLVEMLTVYASFCEKFNLRYYLAYGTLLGAIREKGFIPWDFDVDVSMPRPDYMRFLEITRSQPIGEGYSVLSPYINKKYTWFFIKISADFTYFQQNIRYIIYENHGVFLDIFPLDGLPDDVAEREDLLQKIRELRELNQFARRTIDYSLPSRFRPRKMVEFLRKLSFKAFIGYHGVFKRLDALVRRYDFDTSREVYSSSSSEFRQTIASRSDFAETIDVTFEGRTFKAPKGYDSQLRNLYGVYMTPPPPAKRKGDAYHFFWR